MNALNPIGTPGNTKEPEHINLPSPYKFTKHNNNIFTKNEEK